MNTFSLVFAALTFGSFFGGGIIYLFLVVTKSHRRAVARRKARTRRRKVAFTLTAWMDGQPQVVKETLRRYAGE